MRGLPSGTVTLLFTDIEGSTRLLDELGDAYADALAEHRRVFARRFERHGGVEVGTQGDAFFVAFRVGRRARRRPGGPACARLGPGPRADGRPHGRADRDRRGLRRHRRAPRRADRGCRPRRPGRRLRRRRGQLVGRGRPPRPRRAPAEGHRRADGSSSSGTSDFPPLRTLASTNLPRPTTPLVGRERRARELADAAGEDARLVTSTGPAARQDAPRARGRRELRRRRSKAGCLLVDLAAVRDPTRSSRRSRRALGDRTSSPRALGDRELLLVLDNVEQVRRGRAPTWPSCSPRARGSRCS